MALDKEKLENDLQRVFDQGIRALAVVLTHSYTCPTHEIEVADIARRVGFTQISLSSAVNPMVKMVPRGFTACAAAYLTPLIVEYIDGFTRGFPDALAHTATLFMQSDGGLVPARSFDGARAVLSGPAGGVVGLAATAFEEHHRAVIGFDMGGTSTDVARYDGAYDHVFESSIAGIAIQAPQLDINTVAAGGGSILRFAAGLFFVGPESAGAVPGPACYRMGGPLTVTDANLFLGRLHPDLFPAIFGPNKNEPLDRAASAAAFRAITDDINRFRHEHGDSTDMTPEEVALGFLRVANEAMCRPVRALTQAKGHDTRNHVLACFGGAGGQHACTIAAALGIERIHISRFASVLSAFGLASADVVAEAMRPAATTLTEEACLGLAGTLRATGHECVARLQADGFSMDNIVVEAYLNIRFAGTDCNLMTPASRTRQIAATQLDTLTCTDSAALFLENYRREFGFVLATAALIVDDLRVRAIGRSGVCRPRMAGKHRGPPVAARTVPVHFDDGFEPDTPVYLLDLLGPDVKLRGPALVVDPTFTMVLPRVATLQLTEVGDLDVVLDGSLFSPLSTAVSLVQLTVFGHLFMSIAEQMGRTLQRTAISTNIKERLDFSCAIFSPDGGLVANAPHIPVHLGAMQEAVRYQIAAHPVMTHGDVYVSNHPAAGGSHLPDITVITPVFHLGPDGTPSEKPVFFVASRGHHADIGGITPGSMPPHSRALAEEGAAIMSCCLVRQGVFQEDVITSILTTPNPAAPGSSGTRRLGDNISDLKAQIAANQKGIALVNELILQYSLEVVHAYMLHIQASAETAVRGMLKERAARAIEENQQNSPQSSEQVEEADEETRITSEGLVVLSARDQLDDGSVIALSVTIDPAVGSAHFDFTGTGPEVFGNCNAPRAVTHSAVIYCLRAMVAMEIPLNQGCLRPVTIDIPRGSLLWPSDGAAVVGGNVLTSQRVVDVILRAFDHCAASQGCMNNVTFGNSTLSYYETVAGGAGAGPGWHGRSGVHTHMTNTRITDPEILERRFPVVLRAFGLRTGSGGAGQYVGGEGVQRVLEFRCPLTLSILSERRALAPYGKHGGHPGRRGVNLLRRADGRVISLGAKCSVDVNAGDVFELLTPGGGGWGSGPRAAGPGQQRAPRLTGSVQLYSELQHSV